MIQISLNDGITIKPIAAMAARMAAAQAVAVTRLLVGGCPLIVYLPVSDWLVDAISPDGQFVGERHRLRAGSL